MAYLALYRTWRPQQFQDVIGQEHVTKTLQNALKRQRFAHAYLFNGPRGTGKTSAAKIMAKAVNCMQGPLPEPCNECEACRGITEGSTVDVVEIDAASNRGVEEIRDLRENVKYAPSEVRYKVYIIDEVHMLTTEAFNALLKTLEEPPEHVIFILATTEPHKLPLTIISRCQRFDFRRISVQDIVQRMQKICEANEIEADEKALALIARVAEGGMRDALSLLDQVLSYGEATVTIEHVLAVTGAVSHAYLSKVVRCIHEKDVPSLLDLLDDLMAEGKEPERLLDDLIHYFRDMLLYQSAPRLEEVRERLLLDESFEDLAKEYTQETLYTIIKILNESRADMKWGSHRRIMLEVTLIKLCEREEEADQPQISQEQLAPLLQRIQRMEQQLKQLAQPSEQADRSGVQEASNKPVERGKKAAKRVPSQRIRSVWQNASQEKLKALNQQWGKILQIIKEQKIQVHAWFVDGTPVAADENHVVVAFKSPIHRETTEKPDHRELIESCIQTVTGEPLQLLTIMEPQWEEIARSAAETSAGSEDEEKKDPLIEEAIKLAGEDLVQFKD